MKIEKISRNIYKIRGVSKDEISFSDDENGLWEHPNIEVSGASDIEYDEDTEELMIILEEEDAEIVITDAIGNIEEEVIYEE